MNNLKFVKSILIVLAVQLIKIQNFIRNRLKALMFGKIENWLGELCAAASTEDEEDMDSFAFQTFDNLVPEELYEQEEEDSKSNVISDTESRFNVSRSRKYRVKRVNVKPAPSSAQPAPSEQLDRENDSNQRTNHRRRRVKEYKPAALPVVENENSQNSEEKKLETWQKRDCFPGLHQSANFFDLKELPMTRGISRYRFPKTGQKYLEANNPFLRRPPRRPHHNLLVPCNWTTEELSSTEPEPRPPQIPSKQSNANRRLFQKKHFKISGMQKTAKDKSEEIPLKRVLEDKLDEGNSEQQKKNEDNFSHSSVEIFETEKVLSHELINKPHQYSEVICHDPCYIEEPQTNQPAECKVNICIMNLGNEEEAWEQPPAEQESKDKKNILGKMSLLDLKLLTKPDKEVEDEVCFSDVEVLKDGNWC